MHFPEAQWCFSCGALREFDAQGNYIGDVPAGEQPRYMRGIVGAAIPPAAHGPGDPWESDA